MAEPMVKVSGGSEVIKVMFGFAGGGTIPILRGSLLANRELVCRKGAGHAQVENRNRRARLM